MHRSPTRRLVAIAVAGVLVLGGCGVDSGSGTGPSPTDTFDPTTPGTGGGSDRPDGEVIDGDVLTVESVTDGRRPADTVALVADNVGWEAYAGSHAAIGDLGERLLDAVEEVPEERRLAATVVAVGCDVPEGAELIRNGTDVTMRPTGLPEESTTTCVAPVVSVAVLAVDEDLVSDVETVDGRSAEDPVGPGELLAFENVFEFTNSIAAVELDGSEDPEELAATLGLDDAIGLMPDQANLPEDVRRFAFVRPGCAHNTMEVILDAETIIAQVRDSEVPRELIDCAEAVYYFGVFDVDAHLIPDTAVLAD